MLKCFSNPLLIIAPQPKQHVRYPWQPGRALLSIKVLAQNIKEVQEETLLWWESWDGAALSSTSVSPRC